MTQHDAPDRTTGRRPSSDARPLSLPHRFSAALLRRLDGTWVELTPALAHQLAAKRTASLARTIREQRELTYWRAEAAAYRRAALTVLLEEREAERRNRALWRTLKTAKFNRAPPPRKPHKPTRSGNLGGASSLPAFSSAIVDRLGRRNVFLRIRYYGRKTTRLGVCRRAAIYVVNGAVETEDGMLCVFSNVAATPGEAIAAMELLEQVNRETSEDAKLLFHIIGNVPWQFTHEQMMAETKRFADAQFGSRDLPYIVALHPPSEAGDQRNWHFHILASTRPMRRVGDHMWDVGEQLRTEIDNPEAFRRMRELYAEIQTEVAHEAGLNLTYTALSNAARGLPNKPQEHLGGDRTDMVRRDVPVAANDRNWEISVAGEQAILDEQLRHEQEATERETALIARALARFARAIPAALLPSQARSTPGMAPVTRVACGMASPQRADLRPVHALDEAPVATSVVSNLKPSIVAVSARASTLSGTRLDTQSMNSLPYWSQPLSSPVVVAKTDHPSGHRASSYAIAVAATLTPGASRPFRSFAAPVTILAAAQTSAPRSVFAVSPILDAPASASVTALVLAPVIRPVLARSAAVRGDEFALTPRPSRATVAGLTMGREPKVPARAPQMTIRIRPPQRPSVPVRARVPVAQPLIPRPEFGRMGVEQALDPVPAASRSAKLALINVAATRVAWSALPDDHASAVEALLRRRAAREIARRRDIERKKRLTEETARREAEERLLADAETDARRIAAEQAEQETLDLLRENDPWVRRWQTQAEFSVSDAALTAINRDRVWEAGASAQAVLAALSDQQDRVLEQLEAAPDGTPPACIESGRVVFTEHVPADVRRTMDSWSSEPDLVRLVRHWWPDSEPLGQSATYQPGPVIVPEAEPSKPATSTATVATTNPGRRLGNPKVGSPDTPAAAPLMDGFGGVRTTPAPLYEYHDVGGARVAPYIRGTSKPTGQLLILARFAGENPLLIDRASDGRLMALRGASPMVVSLLAMWRDSEAIDTLITRIITDSRAAGKPTWPPEFATDLSTRRAVSPRRPLSDLSRGPSG